MTTRFGGETVRAFVPAPLPPSVPLDLAALLPVLGEADRALGRLDGLSRLLPDPTVFLYAYVRKEAVVSSQIEGTQSTLADLFALETGLETAVGFDDVQEVSNYVAAMDHGLERLGTLPLSLRMMREIHGILLRGTRGAGKEPGEFRRSQNWIGGSRPGNALYVPPPPGELDACLGDLERFLHASGDGLPPLVRAGLAHVQFETIHPFLDGNGRLGRLLVTLMLCANGVLEQPLLYLSLFLKTHRDDYYRLLQEVRMSGAWNAWLDFFLRGVAETATGAVDSARRILALMEADRRRIEDGAARAGSVLRVHDHLRRHPVGSQKTVSAATGLSPPTVNGAFAELERLGIAREVTGRGRNRAFAYAGYIAILNEGAAPIPA